MKFRHIVSLLSVLTLFAFTAAPADAATGPKRLQKLAEAQTGLLLASYADGATVSPPVCGQGQDRNGVKGAFLLPTLSFNAGVVTLRCSTQAHSVLVDLGGAVVTEDADPTSTYTLVTGEVLRFTPGNLERICDDVLVQRLVHPSTGTVDGREIRPIAVATRAFDARVTPAAADFYAASEQLGHPGRLAASYCGFKAELKLRHGRHVIRVDLSDQFTPPEQAVLTYVVDVGR